MVIQPWKTQGRKSMTMKQMICFLWFKLLEINSTCNNSILTITKIYQLKTKGKFHVNFKNVKNIGIFSASQNRIYILSNKD